MNGDPVDGVDPLGLGLGDLLNPWSSHNPIREWAAGGSLASKLLYLNPAYLAVIGYGAEAQAWENGCSLWTVAGYGAAGTLGLASIALWFPTNAVAPVAEDVLATPEVENTTLQNIVDDLYGGTTNPNRVGNGTTADAIRNELETGLPTGGRFHFQKGLDYARALENFLRRNPDASYRDRLVAQSLLDDLRGALGGR